MCVIVPDDFLYTVLQTMILDKTFYTSIKNFLLLCTLLFQSPTGKTIPPQVIVNLLELARSHKVPYFNSSVRWGGDPHLLRCKWPNKKSDIHKKKDTVVWHQGSEWISSSLGQLTKKIWFAGEKAFQWTLAQFKTCYFQFENGWFWYVTGKIDLNQKEEVLVP